MKTYGKSIVLLLFLSSMMIKASVAAQPANEHVFPNGERFSSSMSELMPPTELTAEVDSNSVILDWQAPINECDWLHYDNGENYNSIGLSSGGDFSVAIRFTPGQLEEYEGKSITTVRFFPDDYSPDYELKIWKGENANNLIYQQTVSSPTIGEWNEVLLDTPVAIDVDSELWIGYSIYEQAPWQHPAGGDDGPAIEGYGDLIKLDEVWETLYYYGYNWNWNIQACLKEGNGEPLVLEPNPTPGFNNPSAELTLSSSNGVSRGNVECLAIEPLGYNIYRDNIKLNDEPYEALHYTDSGLFSGTYTYEVTAVYDVGESEPATLEVTVDVPQHFTFAGGNPADSLWTIYLASATVPVGVQNYDMEAGDEIAVFDGETLVGAFILDEVLSPENQYDNALIAWSTLVNGNGYDPGNPVTFKCWDASEQKEYENAEITFYDPYGDAWTEAVFPYGDGVFSIASLAFVDTHFLFEGGNAADPVWTVYLAGGAIEDMDLQLGDEIAAFDGETMVGAFILDQVLSPEDQFDNPLTVFNTLNSGEGYLPGNPVTFKCWDASEEQEYENALINFSDPYGDAWTDPVFPEGDGQYSIADLSFTSSYFNFEGGNPAEPVWTLFLAGATLENEDLLPGDEIAVFDGDTMVGSFQLTEILTPQNQLDNPLTAFSVVYSGNGYTPGNPISFQCYDQSANKAIDTFDVTFYNPFGDAWEEPVFPAGDGAYSIIDLAFSSGGSMQQLYLNGGFEFVSSHMGFADPDLMTLCEHMIYQESLEFIRNSEGAMFQKAGPNWINNIGDWNTTEGYLFNMNEDDMLMLEGVYIDPATPILLEEGHSFISYLPAQIMDATVAVGSIMNNLEFMRDGQGKMMQMLGPMWVNNIGNMIPGKGYLVRMSGSDELIYPESGEKSTKNPDVEPAHYCMDDGNPAEAVFTIYMAPGKGIERGDEVAAISNGKVLGSMVITGSQAVGNDLPVFSTLKNNKGYRPGESIELYLWDKSDKRECKLTFEMLNPFGDAHMKPVYPYGDGLYSMVKIIKTQLAQKGAAFSKNDLINRPNPFRKKTTVEYALKRESHVKLTIYNSMGQALRVLSEGNQSAGTHRVVYDAGDLSPGLYTCKLEVISASGRYSKNRIMIRK